MRASPRRTGFTLIELLVVTIVIAMFLGLVATTGRQTAASQVRQLTQQFSSAILAAQTRALGKESGSAILIAPGGPAGSTLAGNMTASNTIWNAEMLPLVTGSVVAGIPPANLSLVSTTGTFAPLNADATDMNDAYRIYFYCDSPPMPPTRWMSFLNPSIPNNANADTLTATVGLRGTSSQTTFNTVWPLPPVGGSLKFAAARLPKPAATAIDTIKTAAIDLRFSGVGNAVTGSYGSLNNLGSLAICFDRTGNLEMIMQTGTQTVAPLMLADPVYFLVATLADIQNGTSLRAESSRWLAIAPSTGRITVSPNVVQTGTTTTNIQAARANARQGITGGGR